ncbi:adhesion G-protein coupled receptor G5 [Alca torda]
MEGHMDILEELLQQGCGSAHHTRERLNQLEKNLTRWKKYNFTGSMIETFVFKFRTEQFRRLDLSSSMDEKPGGDRRFRHAMNFPVEPVKDNQARGVEQELICIYIHSLCIFQAPQLLQDAHNCSVLNNDVVGAFLRSGRVAGLCRAVKIQFWQDTVLLPAGALTPAHLASLTHITTVGYSLSATSTLCTLLLCCFSRQWLRDNMTRIHMHLLAALLLLNCSFLLSTPLATGAEGLCQAIAALLHASLLCALAWMATEAFHFLLLLVKVYNIYIQHYLLKLFLFAWGLTVLAVAAVFVFKKDAYGYHTISTSDDYRNTTIQSSSTRCWLTSSLVHYTTLWYAGLILLFNTLVLGRVVMILRRVRQQKEQAWKGWATVLGLTCLLGTTWHLAFFRFSVFLVPQIYLFTILNSLQVTVHCRSKPGSVSNTSR